MFVSCKSSNSDSISGSDSDSFFPFVFSNRKLMATSDPEHKCVMDFKTYYTSKERITYFQKHINLSSSDDEEEFILEVYSTVKGANMAALDDYPSPCF